MAQKLLLADDSITIQKVVELVLAEEDFEIKSVSNGEDALNIIESFRPDIVLADIEMPKINGYQLCEKIKQNPNTSSVPVILLAGAFEPIDEELARTVGADDSVIKPFESQELISKINAALTMVSAGEVEAIAAEEGEAFEIAEEAEELVEEEGVEVAGAEEDLWAMEDVAAPSEELAEEALAEEEVADFEGGFELPKEEFAAGKAAVDLKAAAAPRTEAVSPRVEVPQIVMPSKEELLAVCEKAVRERVSSLAGPEMKEAVLAALGASLKDSIDKILWEIAPELVEKMLRETLKNSMVSLTKEVEKVIWETLPDLAGTMISKEIEKIKSEF